MKTIKTTTWVSLKVAATVVMGTLMIISIVGVAGIPSMMEVMWGLES